VPGRTIQLHAAWHCLRFGGGRQTADDRRCNNPEHQCQSDKWASQHTKGTVCPRFRSVKASSVEVLRNPSDQCFRNCPLSLPERIAPQRNDTSRLCPICTQFLLTGGAERGLQVFSHRRITGLLRPCSKSELCRYGPLVPKFYSGNFPISVPSYCTRSPVKPSRSAADE
jgi:hypothetical protein